MAALSPPPYEMADSMEMEGLSYKDRLMEGEGGPPFLRYRPPAVQRLLSLKKRCIISLHSSSQTPLLTSALGWKAAGEILR